MKRLLVIILFLFNFVFSTSAQEIIVQTLFKPIKKVYPDYPERLKKEGVAARFLIWISIDRKGNVIRASASNRFYPELETYFVEGYEQILFMPFGSCADGTDVRESDIDIFMLTQEKKAVKESVSRFNQKSERKISPIILDVSEFMKMKREDGPLYERIDRDDFRNQITVLFLTGYVDEYEV